MQERGTRWKAHDLDFELPTVDAGSTLVAPGRRGTRMGRLDRYREDYPWK